MKKCSDCNVEMINADIHTDIVGGTSFEELLYIDYEDEEHGSKILFSKEKRSTREINARVCPKCGKVELYVELEDKPFKDITTSNK